MFSTLKSIGCHHRGELINSSGICVSQICTYLYIIVYPREDGSHLCCGYLTLSFLSSCALLVRAATYAEDGCKGEGGLLPIFVYRQVQETDEE